MFLLQFSRLNSAVVVFAESSTNDSNGRIPTGQFQFDRDILNGTLPKGTIQWETCKLIFQWDLSNGILPMGELQRHRFDGITPLGQFQREKFKGIVFNGEHVEGTLSKGTMLMG